METESVLSPLAVTSVFRSSKVLRLTRYLEKAMLLSALSLMPLLRCLILLLRSSVSKAKLFSLSANSSIPISPTAQSSNTSSLTFPQCLESPKEQRVLLVMRCQLMLRFNRQRSLQFSPFKKQLAPSSSTEVAWRSSVLRCLINGDSERMTNPQLEMSELPYSTRVSNFAIQLHLDMRTRESSVI